MESDEPECQRMEHENGIAFEGESVVKGFLFVDGFCFEGK